MKHFLVYTNHHKDRELKITKRIQFYIESKGHQCSITLDGESNVLDKFDYMIVLGGDGTMLRAAREIKASHMPMIGVNLGTLGFMTEIETSDIEEAIDQILMGNYEIESRMMLRGQVVTSEGEKIEDWALNDIVISRSGSLKIISFNIYVNGQFLNSYKADGFIVTTPTGSTGYNLSAGGPIVEPNAKLIVLTPICPHTLNQRSVILSPDDIVEIEIPRGREGTMQQVEVCFDGASVIHMKTGDRINIIKSEKTTELLLINKVSFLTILHKKMSEKE